MKSTLRLAAGTVGFLAILLTTYAAPKYNPGTQHWYEAINAPCGITWDEANALAIDKGGYLACVESAEENQFIFVNFPAASQSNNYGFWIGGVQPGDTTDPDVDPAADWEWVTGELFDYTNWSVDEPNDYLGKEDATQLWNNDGTWNDNFRENTTEGLVVEYSGTVVIDGCDSGAPNVLLDPKTILSGVIVECGALAENHGDFVSCVAKVTNTLKKAGLISGREKGAIQSCAAQANIP